MESQLRKPYPTDITDDEWVFLAPYLTLMDPDAPQRRHDLCKVFNALLWIVRTGAQCRMLPTIFPLWAAVSQQTPRWFDESGARAGYDGYKRRKGSKIHEQERAI
jgi:transposase